jgi:hypothetical protein
VNSLRFGPIRWSQADHVGMSDRPTPSDPDPSEQARPANEASALPQGDPAATAPLPPQYPAAPQQHPYPGPSQGQPSWSQPSGSAWPGAGVPVAAGATAAPGPPSGPRRWWDEATSTGGGRAALVLAAVLAALLLLTGFGLTTAFALRHVGGDDGVMGRSLEDRGPGMGMGNQGNGKGLGLGRGNGNGRGNGKGTSGGDDDEVVPPPGIPGNGNGNGNGLGLGRGAAMLGAGVLHGEFTTSLTGTPTVMVVQTGQVTAYTAGKSLAVKSSDGFRATYALDGTVTQGRGTGALATGVQVRVLAAKEGMKVIGLKVG